MSIPGSELDEHLHALFDGLDTRTDFDARLMSRLLAESQTDATQRRRALQQERARYRRAVLELRSGRRSMLRLLTLDTLGIALLLAVAVITAWPHFNRDILDITRQYGSYIVTSIGILIAVVPLLGMWAERSHRSIRL